MSVCRVNYYFLNKILMVKSFQRIFERSLITKKLICGDQSITVHVRQMLEEDIPQIKELRRRNNFYDPVSIYSMYLKLDPTAFVVAEDGQGKVVGVLAAFNAIENLCVGGMRVVHEDYRSIGLSSKLLFPRGLELAGNRTRVTYTEFKELLYNKKRIPYITKNFTLIEFVSKNKIHPEKLSSDVPPGVEIRRLGDSHMAALLEYDRLTSGYSREELVKFFCRDPLSETVAALRNGQCVGYGIIKMDIQGGKKVGPLYADTPEIAEAILKQLLESFELAEGFHGNALSNNAYALSLYEKLGEMKTFVNYMLCSKDVSWPEYKNVYSVFELEIQPI